VSTVHVLKFGGTSLASVVRIRRAARRVAAHVRRGRRVVAVVSAAGEETDRILARAARLGATADAGRAAGAEATVDAGLRLDPAASAGVRAARELDRALATGEDRSAALLAATLLQLGVPARSLRGGEAGVYAVGPFGAGTIEQVAAGRLRHLVETGVVPVVSGFQALRGDGETVTLGRGGSDTSAVAIAAALGAACHIITDVAAVYDRDPAAHPDARPLPRLTHAELLRLVEGGAQVVHPAAARIALAADVPLRIYHFRAPPHVPGTLVQTVRAARVAAAGGAS
jgi:aspartate kinase